MKVRFNRQEMAEALSAVGSVAAARTPKQILQCVHIEAHPDYLMLSATDLELGIRSAVSQVEVAEGGQVVVHADMLGRIVRECADDLLGFETQENTLHIRGEDSHFQIRTSEAEDFPPVPVIEGGDRFCN